MAFEYGRFILIFAALISSGLQLSYSASLDGSISSSTVDSGDPITICSTTSCSVDSRSMKRDVIFENTSSTNHSDNIEANVVQTAEFTLLRNIITGIIHKFTVEGTTSHPLNVTDVNEIANSTKNVPSEEKEDNIETSNPSDLLYSSLKSLIPPFLSELLQQLTEVSNDYNSEESSQSENDKIIEKFRQTLLDAANDQTINDKSDTNSDQIAGLKKDLEKILEKIKNRKHVKMNKVDLLCETLDMQNNNISLLNETIPRGNETNRIVLAAMKFHAFICEDPNKQLLEQLMNSKNIWSSRIPQKIISRTINRISRKKPVLKLILNMILAVMLDIPF